jgi:hypothetical protein
MQVQHVVAVPVLLYVWYQCSGFSCLAALQAQQSGACTALLRGGCLVWDNACVS